MLKQAFPVRTVIIDMKKGEMCWMRVNWKKENLGFDVLNAMV
jgi:hypothetical protein